MTKKRSQDFAPNIVKKHGDNYEFERRVITVGDLTNDIITFTRKQQSTLFPPTDSDYIPTPITDAEFANIIDDFYKV